jgi:type I restriction enzyme S subunit
MHEGWVATALGDVTTFASGYAFSERHQGKARGEWPFFKVSDMNSPANLVALVEANNRVDRSDLKEMRARSWPAGTVVFPKVGAALLTEKRRILGVEGCFDNNVLGLVPGPSILPHYLLLLMQTVRLADWAQHGAVPSVNQRQVAAIEIGLPSLAEQRRIVDLVVLPTRVVDGRAADRRLSGE